MGRDTLVTCSDFESPYRIINSNAAQVLVQALNPNSKGSIFPTFSYNQETYDALYRMVDAWIFREIRSIGIKLADGILKDGLDFALDLDKLEVGEIRLGKYLLRIVN